MKIFRAIISLLLLLALLSSCEKNPPSYSNADGFPALPTTDSATTDTTAETTTENAKETTSAASTNEPSCYELPYKSQSEEPIYPNYRVEDLQWRAGDGTRRDFTIISRVYNGTNSPVVIHSASLSLKAGNISSQNIHQSFTPHYYLMPYQTGYVVIPSNTRIDFSTKLEDVDYSYSVTTNAAKNVPVQYFAESATATVRHKGSRILDVQLDIIMKDPPSTRFVQINGALYNRDGIAVDAFSSKLTQRNGIISLSHFPDMNLSTDDIAFYSFTMTSQCNE